MAVGGFDLIYPSPFICDWDFFLEVELIGCKFSMTHGTHFYHFGSKATKNRDDQKKNKSLPKVRLWHLRYFIVNGVSNL